MKLFISDGQVEVPDVTPMNLEEAKAKLTELGLRVETVEEESEDAEKGTILKQSPGPGAVDQGSTITLTIAKKVEIQQVTVPSLTGWDRASAEGELFRLGLIPRVEEVFDNGVPAGQVMRTEPDAGQQRDVGSEVKVIVSKGPENQNPGNGDEGDGGWGNGDQGGEDDD